MLSVKTKITHFWPETKWQQVLTVSAPQQGHNVLSQFLIIGVPSEVIEGLVDAVIAVIVSPQMNVLVLIADKHTKTAYRLAMQIFPFGEIADDFPVRFHILFSAVWLDIVRLKLDYFFSRRSQSS